MKYYALLLAVMCCTAGCRKEPYPSVMWNTHKVWYSLESMIYQSDDGFTCARIDKVYDGWVYKADVLNWSPDAQQNLQTDWNTLQDAEKWVQRRCKP